MLQLTRVSTRQIVRAKWWAVVWHYWRDYVLLAIMRIGAVSYMALNFTVDFTFGRHPSFSYGRSGPELEPLRTTIFLIAIAIVLLSVAIIAILTMLNLMFTASCGIVGAAVAQRTALALIYSLGVYLFPIIIIGLLAGVPGYLVLKPDIENFGYQPSAILSTIALILMLTSVTIVDKGSLASGLLMRFGYDFRWSQALYKFEFFTDRLRGNAGAFLTSLLLGMIIYVVLIFALLRRAEKIIAKQSEE